MENLLIIIFLFLMWSLTIFILFKKNKEINRLNGK